MKDAGPVNEAGRQALAGRDGRPGCGSGHFCQLARGDQKLQAGHKSFRPGLPQCMSPLSLSLSPGRMGPSGPQMGKALETPCILVTQQQPKALLCSLVGQRAPFQCLVSSSSLLVWSRGLSTRRDPAAVRATWGRPSDLGSSRSVLLLGDCGTNL